MIFLIFAFLFGALVNASCIERGKVRNVSIAIGIGLLCSFSCISFQYVFIKIFSGHLHLILLLLEAIYLTSMVVFFTMVQAKKPFSESQQKWYLETTLPSLSLIANEGNLAFEVNTPGYEPYEHFRKVSSKDQHSSISIYYLTGEINYISVTNYKLASVRNYKSLSKFDSNKILTYYPISEATGSKFREGTYL